MNRLIIIFHIKICTHILFHKWHLSVLSLSWIVLIDPNIVIYISQTRHNLEDRLSEDLHNQDTPNIFQFQEDPTVELRVMELTPRLFFLSSTFMPVIVDPIVVQRVICISCSCNFQLCMLPATFFVNCLQISIKFDPKQT